MNCLNHIYVEMNVGDPSRMSPFRRGDALRLKMTAYTRRKMLITLLALPFALSEVDLAYAQGSADCSAAVQRVLAQTNGELLSVSVTKSGGQDVCKITVLANDSSGKRRRKVTVNARP